VAVTIAGDRAANLGLYSALRAFEQGGIFIVPHLLRHLVIIDEIINIKCFQKTNLILYIDSLSFRRFNLVLLTNASPINISNRKGKYSLCWLD
jgi:hypothetical protein